jgi:hypothetical protein
MYLLHSLSPSAQSWNGRKPPREMVMKQFSNVLFSHSSASGSGSRPAICFSGFQTKLLLHQERPTTEVQELVTTEFPLSVLVV